MGGKSAFSRREKCQKSLFHADKCRDTLAMLRPRKQIHGLHFFCAIPILLQPCGVAGGSGGVAADVHHPAGSHAYHGGEGSLVTALAGRVQHYDIRVQPLSGELGGSLPGIGAEKAALGGYGLAHAGGVGLGALNGLRHDLHANQLPALIGHGKADGAHAAVEIQQRIIRGKLRVLRGNAVQPLGSQCVDLIEGQRPQTHRYAAKGVLNVARAVQDMVLAAQNDIGVFGVDVKQNGADGRELLPQRGAELLCVGKLCTGAYKAYHDLSAVRAAPQEDVPYQPLAALLIVGADALLRKKGTQRVTNFI